MNQAFRSKSFHWPSIEDRCYVPDTHILCRIEAPTTTTGRQYYITEADINRNKAEVQNQEMLKASLKTGGTPTRVMYFVSLVDIILDT